MHLERTCDGGPKVRLTGLNYVARVLSGSRALLRRDAGARSGPMAAFGRTGSRAATPSASLLVSGRPRRFEQALRCLLSSHVIMWGSASADRSIIAESHGSSIPPGPLRLTGGHAHRLRLAHVPSEPASSEVITLESDGFGRR
jgi:hypothetical protein